MSTYEDTSDISLEDISGEFYAVASRPYNVLVKKSVYEVNVNGGGPVAVGSYANITGVSASKPTEEYEKSPSLKSHEIDSKLSYYARNGEDDYCPHNYYIQTIVADWTPKPLNGILIQEGEIHFQWSVEFFLENPEKFIREMDTCAGSLKEEKELFILHGILPYLEQQMWGKSGSNNIDVYRVLAHVSSSRVSGDVAKHSLQQLEHLLCRDRIQSAKQNLLSVEKILRLTIVSPDGAFKEEADSIRLSRLKVYGCILSELIIHQNQGRFSKIESENNLKQLREIKNFFSKISWREKDFLRYSIEFIQQAISYLTQPLNKTLNSNLGNYFEECKRYFASSGIPNEEFSLLKKLKKSEIKRCELHCILYYLHRKVYTERPEQVNQEWRTMDLLDLVLKAHLNGGGGVDWRFCLLASSILSEITMKNATKALRLKASLCLDHLRKNEEVSKNPKCRAIIDRFSREMLFSPDSSITSLLVTYFYDNQTEQYTLPKELHNQHLESSYKTHALKIDNVVTTEPSRETSRCFVSHGALKRQEVAVKVLAVSKGDLAPKESSTQSEAKKRLRKEAYNLWQLGNLKLNHPNIPYLLAYNTVNLPHHIITPYEKYGNLLHFVRNSRECRPLSSATLYKMIIGVIEALQILHQKLNLVHRAVMAENVLVGAGYVPKLSGMHSLEVLQRGVNKDGDYDYAENHNDLKDFIGEESETLSVRYKAPETLSSNRYSIASDVWAFGVFSYETLTLGCRPYRGIQKDEDVRGYVLQRADDGLLEILPQESCIKDDEYNQMKQCWKKERSERIDLSEFKEKFKEMRKKIVCSGDEEPRLDPPSLKMSIESEPQQSQGSSDYDLYEAVPDEEKLQLDPPSLKMSIESEPQKSQGLMESEIYTTISDYSDIESTSGTIYENQYYCEEDTYEPVDVGFGTPETLVDLQTNYQQIPPFMQDAMKEKIPVGDKQHLRRLLCLSHRFLLPISRIDHLDSRSPVVDIISPRSPFGNLKEFVLSRRCPLKTSSLSSARLPHLYIIFT